MFKKMILVWVGLLLTSCGSLPFAPPADIVVGGKTQVNFTQWDVPHTNLTMLLPEDWVSEYYQGTFTIASDSGNLFYSPSEDFEGVLIQMFVSDGPRAVGPSFDVMKLAEDYIADQPNVIQKPTLVDQDGRQIVTTLHVNTDTKGKLITYLTGFVLENQELTVFLAATPNETEIVYLPILTKMLYSIEIRSSL